MAGNQALKKPVSSTKDELANLIYDNVDPFLAFHPNPNHVDMQG
jgi:hypothetical protein